MKKLIIFITLFLLLWSTPDLLISSKVDKIDQSKNHLIITAIDVKQGDSELIITPDFHVVLIDAGEKTKGRDIVTPYMQNQNISRIHTMVVSHPHADHVAGLDPVLDNFTVDEVLDPGYNHTSQTYQNFLTKVANKSIPLINPSIGDVLSWDAKMYVKVYHTSSTKISGKINNTSICLKTKYSNFSMFFTGDSETEAENMMVSSWGTNLSSTIIKVPHHGSDTSSSSGYLDDIDPDWGIICVGSNNKYGHPKQSTLDRYANKGIDLKRTDQHGTIQIKSDGTDYQINQVSDLNNQITSPASDSTHYDSIPVTVKLAQNSSTGDTDNVRLIRVSGTADSDSPHCFTLSSLGFSLTSTGWQTFNITKDTVDIKGKKLKDGAVYRIELNSDTSSDVCKPVFQYNVIFRVTDVPNQFQKPESSTIVNSPFYVKIKLGRDSTAGSSDIIKFTRASGASDPDSPHIFKISELGFNLGSTSWQSNQISSSTSDTNGNTLNDGTVYNVKLETDHESGSATPITHYNVTYALNPNANSFFLPESGAELSTNFNIEIQLGADSSGGNLDYFNFIRTGGNADPNSPHVFKLTNLGFILSLLSNQSKPLSISTPDTNSNYLVAGSVYTIELHTDTGGGPAPTIAHSNITFGQDIIINEFEKPSSGDTLPGTFNVILKLGESATNGQLIFTRTGGTADSNSPHVFSLTNLGFNLSSLEKQTNQITFYTRDKNGNQLINGTIYQVKLDTQTTSGSAQTETHDDITFTAVSPDNTFSKPVSSSSVGSDFPVVIKLGTDSTAGVNDRFTFTRTGGKSDSNSPHIFILTNLGFVLNSLSYQTQTISASTTDSNGFTLNDGTIYTVKLESDSATGPADIIEHTMVEFDISTESNTITKPSENSTVVPPFTLEIQLGESSSFGFVVFSNSGGTVDADSPHVFLLTNLDFDLSDTGVQANLINKTTTDTNGNVLIDGSIYKISLHSKDLLTNTANIESINNITCQTSGVVNARILLVVDASESGFNIYRSVFENALTANGFAYDIKRADESSVGVADIPESLLNQYTNVIWYMPFHIDDEISDSAQQTALSNYLKNGGHLFVCGDDIGYNLDYYNMGRSFYEDWLCADFVNDSYKSSSYIKGEDLFNDLGLMDFDPDNNYPSEISANSPGIAFLNFNNDTKKCGVLARKGNYYSAYVSFNLELLTQQEKRNQLVKKVIHYLEGKNLLIAPENNSTGYRRFDVSLYLGKDCSSGNYDTIEFTRTGGTNDSNSPHVFILTNLGFNLSTNIRQTAVISNTTLDTNSNVLQSGSVYRVELKTDDGITTHAIAMISNFTYDNEHALGNQIIEPIDNATAGGDNGVRIILQLGENSTGGSTDIFTFTRTGGTADPDSPHVFNLTSLGIDLANISSQTCAILRTTTDNGGNTLVSGSVYKIELDTDTSSATALTENRDNITVDLLAEGNQLISPSADTFEKRCFNVSVVIGEKFSDFELGFYRTGGTTDLNSPHLFNLNSLGFDTNTIGVAQTEQLSMYTKDNSGSKLVDGTVYSVILRVVDEAGNTAAITNKNITFSDTPAHTNILLVIDSDHSYWATVADFFTYSLDNQGFDYDFIHLSTASIYLPSSVLNQYNKVIWETIRWTGVLFDSNQYNALNSYLDQNGRLFISGYDIGYQFNFMGQENGTFYRDHLHADYIQDNVSPTYINGTNLSMLRDFNKQVVARNAFTYYEDAVSPVGSAQLIWRYTTAQPNKGAGIAVETNYKVIYHGFNFEQISQASDRNLILKGIINWLDDSTSPAKITDLSAVSSSSRGEVDLQWTSVGDDYNTGTAVGYIVKYSTSPISNQATWDSASVYTQNWTPQSAGQTEQVSLVSLVPNQLYYFAVLAFDETPNEGIVSYDSSAIAGSGDRTYHTINVAGSGGSSDITDWTNSTELMATNKTRGFYMTWDENNIYFAYENDNLNSDDFFIFIDTQAEDNTNGSLHPPSWDSIESHTLPFYADFAVCVENNSYTVGKTWNGSSWSSGEVNGDRIADSYISSVGNGNTEISVSRSILNNPTHIRVLAFGKHDSLRNVINSFPNENPDPGTDTAVQFTHYFNISSLGENLRPNQMPIVYYQDSLAPETISNLQAVPGNNKGEIMLSWSAPNEDNSFGGAVRSYWIKYGTSPFNDSQFTNMITFANTIEPSSPDTPESCVISGLDFNQTYYFRIKSMDDASNISLIDGTSPQASCMPYVQGDFNTAQQFIFATRHGQFKVDVPASTFLTRYDVELDEVSDTHSQHTIIQSASKVSDFIIPPYEISFKDSSETLTPLNRVKITFPYPSNLNLAQQNLLKVYHLTTAGTWTGVDTSIDPQKGLIIYSTESGTYSVMINVPSELKSKPIVYPNPFRPDQAKNGEMKIFNLPNAVTLKIFTISGQMIYEKKFTDTLGGVTWNGKNHANSKVSSGIYIYYIEDNKGNYYRGKISLIW